MKYKPSALILLFLASTILIANSCKKDDQASIKSLFAGGAWEVASIQVFNYIGDTQLLTDTLNEDCNLKQLFSFKTDGTCTFSNYHCKEQLATGNWSLSRDRLYLISDISVQDTSEAGSSKPFENTKILNLGQYSLLIQVGDIQSNYGPKQRRRIVQYGFIRQKNPTSSN